MPEKPPSRTAWEAAIHRAMHQSLEMGAILSDPFAALVLNEEDVNAAKIKECDPATRRFRLYLAARSRFAEDCLAKAIGRGVRQAVILGAGLDTVALRSPHHPTALRIFEVDEPRTQAWKKDRLAQAGLAIPKALTFVAIDFEQDSLANRLPAAGFHSEQPAFFMWLGVVSYLTREAIDETLRFIADVPQSEVVFDYGEPLQNYPAKQRAQVEALAAWVAANGEPWLNLFDPAALARHLCALGFNHMEDLSHKDLADRFYGDWEEPLKRGPGAHVIRAWRQASG